MPGPPWRLDDAALTIYQVACIYALLVKKRPTR